MASTWWRDAVIYQIYPRSFADSNGDGVGDLAGITAHLDHLVDLGVDGLWLSPFYRSPMADYGYDVADYRDVDPLFGDLAAFDRLVAAAHERGLKVVVDWVPNHTSDQHPWFLESRSSRDNPKRDWYVWRDGAPDGGPPNNWHSAFTKVGDAWTYDEGTKQWYLHSFMVEQPDLNWDCDEVRAAMHDVLRFWIDRGVDGFRIDVAHKLAKDSGFGDNPPGVREDRAGADAIRRDQDWVPLVLERLQGIRDVVDEHSGGDVLLVGEVYLLDQQRLIAYVNSGDGLHLAHNFVFVHQPWSALAFASVVDEWEELASEEAWPVWFLENHDHGRVPSRYPGEGAARLALMMLCTLRGTPFLFQGQELGLADVPIPPDRVVDVDGRDPERAPIPWERPSVAGPGAGFTTGEPWLPITPQAEQVAVAAQCDDEASVLHFTRQLLAVRRTTPALRRGDYRRLLVDGGLWAFVRIGEEETVLTVLAFEFRHATLAPVASALRDAGLATEGTVLVATNGRPGHARVEELSLDAGDGVVLRLDAG